MPITSFGVIIFRIHPTNGQREYLMIRRKDTLGYVDFVRGKYQVRENDVNRQYILNMFKQMTRKEKERIRTLPFDVLWTELWNPVTSAGPGPAATTGTGTGTGTSTRMTPMYPDENDSRMEEPSPPLWSPPGSGFTTSSKYRNEESCSSDKFNKISWSEEHVGKKGAVVPFPCSHKSDVNKVARPPTLLESIIEESNQYDTFEEAEWGFPKGRRNYQERDYDCAIREMVEETGFQMQHLKNIKNLLPFEEIFLGSNYKSYKHKYYLMYISYEHTIHHNMNNYERAEVSCMQWKTFDDCLRSIRPYNIEKKRMLYNIESCMNRYKLLCT